MRPDPARLADMAEALERLREIGARGRSAFLSDRIVQSAAAFELLKLGEAATRVGARTKERLPDVRWRELVRLRNRLAHEYFQLDPAESWRFIEEELDPLARALSGSE